MIHVENLTYEYPGQRALDNVSFHIEKQAVTALVGPNGAGKTTLLKCLAGLMRPYNGRIGMNGMDVIENPRSVHRMLGFLPDFFGLYDALTVEQSLAYFAMAQGVDIETIPDRIREILDQLDLGHKIHEKVAGLSRGMRQKLGIGQAMIHDPEILLLDEPASGLDPEARYALSQLFLFLNRNGKTLIVSSHILSELNDYANDLLIIRDGRIVDREKNISETKEKRIITVRIFEFTDSHKSILESMEHVSNIRGENDLLFFDYDGSDEAQHDLLKKLIDAGLGIVEFYVRKETLHEQYLESLK